MRIEWGDPADAPRTIPSPSCGACCVDQDAITLFDSLGFALEDLSAPRALRDIAGFGPGLDLISEPENPKDLFGSVFSRGEAFKRAA